MGVRRWNSPDANPSDSRRPPSPGPRSRDPSVRALQVGDTTKILARDPRKDLQILVGDFNADPAAPELAGLWNRLTDSWAVAESTSGGPNTYPAVDPVKRIDVVAVGKGLDVRRFAVPAELAASDHRPVVADLSFRP